MPASTAGIFTSRLEAQAHSTLFLKPRETGWACVEHQMVTFMLSKTVGTSTSRLEAPAHSLLFRRPRGDGGRCVQLRTVTFMPAYLPATSTSKPEGPEHLWLSRKRHDTIRASVLHQTGISMRASRAVPAQEISTNKQPVQGHSTLFLKSQMAGWGYAQLQAETFMPAGTTLISTSKPEAQAHSLRLAKRLEAGLAWHQIPAGLFTRL